MRLEFMRVASQRLEVGDAVIARAGAEDVAEGQGSEGGIAAGAAAADHQALRVGPAAGDEVERAIDAILDIDNVPFAVEAIAIGAPITAAAAVIHIEHANTAARPVLDPQVERRRRLGGRAAMALDEERRLLARRCRVVGVCRRVVEGIGGGAAAARKGDELRAREIRREIGAQRGRRPDDGSRAALGIDADDCRRRLPARQTIAPSMALIKPQS
jgi:hypothetical protein